jgi:hypothetical protein
MGMKQTDLAEYEMYTTRLQSRSKPSYACNCTIVYYTHCITATCFGHWGGYAGQIHAPLLGTDFTDIIFISILLYRITYTHTILCSVDHAS